VALVSQAEYADRHKVSRKTVTMWKAKEYLVFQGRMVDVEASDAVLRDKRLGRFRDYDPSAAEPQGNSQGNPPAQGNIQGSEQGPALPQGVLFAELPEIGPNGRPVSVDAPAVSDALTAIAGQIDGFLQNVLQGKFLGQAEAEQIKQNALAAKHLLEVRIRSGELVEVAEAEALFFEAFRSERDAWLNWPVRIAPLIAAQFDIDVDLLTEALAHHVNDHLNARGEPDPDFAGEG
jgi:hypothetical protein